MSSAEQHATDPVYIAPTLVGFQSIDIRLLFLTHLSVRPKVMFISGERVRTKVWGGRLPLNT